MIHLKYKRLFGWFAAAAALLLTTSCKDDLIGGTGISDEVTVSFALAPESASASTRAVYDDEHKNQLSNGHISDGSLIDMLVYAIYDEDGNLLEPYEGESDSIEGFTHSEGQTIKAIVDFPCKITLTLKRGATYTVAFWAQSSKCNAYDTKNLRKVEMIYNNIKNNNETLDAFCRSYTFVAGAENIESPIKLYRPLAQVNIGASGFDYETSNRNSTKDYVYTKIRLNRVARYFDVFKDEAYWSTTAEGDAQFEGEKTQETFAVVDYDYALLPAYINMEKRPEYISHTKYDWLYDEDYTFEGDAEKAIYDKEEFLKVHLYTDEKKKDGFNEDGKYTDDKFGKIVDGEETSDEYLDYANLNNKFDKKSETFKYLSMCYVLTSSTKNEAITLNNVKVWIATDENGTDSIEIVNLDNVPVQRNWRTNIIGNLMTDENSFIVKLDKDFAGEFNGIYNNENKETAEWTGYIADGVYYDGEADEIQISNANGLLWFQRMVNGNIRGRETYNKAVANRNYLYYDPNNQKERYLSYDGIPEPTDENLKTRILVATHQYFNKNSNKGEWPTNCNFHFTGTKDDADYPAKVRLMADIDMSGIEWIPIGFDGKMWEQLNNKFEEEDPTNRGFYGKFDGNHHTVSNLTTKRFGTCIPDIYEERDHTSPASRHWDALQWFGRGFFGEVGGYAEIRNLNLRNVDFKGCQGVGGIVGIVSGKAVKIENCIVDGGSIEVTPLYRCDTTNSSDNAKNRTFARGVYLGGIVGYFYNSEQGSELTNCEVRNLTMRGYRRLGGLIGSLGLEDEYSSSKGSQSMKGKISGNSVVNSILIASQFNVFGIKCAYENGVYKTGFGWDEGEYDLLTHPFIGGDEKDLGEGENSSYNLTLSRFTEHIVSDGSRKSELEGAPLKYMPLLSSWYTDDITLQNNYYGEPSAKKIYNQAKFNVYSYQAAANQNWVNYNFPMNIPYDVDIMWADDVNNPNVGLYVESVTLDGEEGVGGRSVITPTKVDEEGACALFVTARDRKQFWENYTGSGKNSTTNSGVYYKAPTILKNLVVRGQPYAHTGIMLSPNENMNKIELHKVAVYDVYKTIAMNANVGGTNQWPNIVDASETELEVVNSNLRGYTIPGAGWKSITFTGTTFEKGKSTSEDEDRSANEQTYEAEKTKEGTTFTDCFFKAPYTIKKAADVKVTLDGCIATAANVNKPIEPANDDWTEIKITSDTQGKAVVEYTYATTTQNAMRK